ncbi:MAG: response regulator transcription factor [Marinilabiliaceae bacterium]|nr:response regulator transcription factor [Marinilabiliaceae bacterium]
MNIWLVDDHQLFRTGFRTLLQKIDQISVTFEASDGNVFLSALRNCQIQPDIVFMDLLMPNMDGLEATEEAIRLYPDLNIIILSMFGEREYYERLINIGIKGFLLKSCDFAEVERAIDVVSGGDMYFSEELLQQIGETSNATNKSVGKDIQSIIEEFSDRELAVLNGICSGQSNQEMADTIFLSKRTIEKHRASLMVKTGCSNTATLVIWAIKNGLYEIKE